jgi:hypothetical protein
VKNLQFSEVALAVRAAMLLTPNIGNEREVGIYRLPFKYILVHSPKCGFVYNTFFAA